MLAPSGTWKTVLIPLFGSRHGLKTKANLMHLLVTGGTGYIGSRLVELATGRGDNVTLLVRDAREPGEPGTRKIGWRLGERPAAEAFRSDDWGNVDAVLHLAHDWNSEETDEELNFEGTRLLLTAARENNVPRFVFCSSIAARPDSINRYGRIKARVETLFTGSNDVAARIGLVYGGPQKAMWGAICGILRLSPVLPMFGTDKPVQPIHLDEVCDSLLGLAAMETPGRRVYGVAGPDAVTFGDFLRQVSVQMCGRKLHLIPLPISLTLFAVSIFNKLPGLPVIDKERILGIAGLRHMPCAEDIAELGLNIRPLHEGLVNAELSAGQP